MDQSTLVAIVLGAIVVSALGLVARRKKSGEFGMKFDLFGAKAEVQDKSTQRRADITAKGVSVGRDAKLAGAEIDLENVAVGRDLDAGGGGGKRGA